MGGYIDKSTTADRDGHGKLWRAQGTAVERLPRLIPIPNYTLSTCCPNCGSDVARIACKVRCTRCNFMWDCSEL